MLIINKGLNDTNGQMIKVGSIEIPTRHCRGASNYILALSPRTKNYTPICCQLPEL